MSKKLTKKQQALFERDPYNYYLETAVQFIQQCGRTTRGSDDWSVVVCGDNRLSWLLQKCDEDLPKSFKEEIQWSSKSTTETV